MLDNVNSEESELMLNANVLFEWSNVGNVDVQDDFLDGH